MQWINSTLAVLIGLLLRLAIPIVITLLAVYILHKVDVRWQEEAAQMPAPEDVEKPLGRNIKNCPVEKKSGFISLNSAEPCWQTHRLDNGYLPEECLDCQVFHQAPIPSPVHP
jgi:hypothetical protein